MYLLVLQRGDLWDVLCMESSLLRIVSYSRRWNRKTLCCGLESFTRLTYFVQDCCYVACCHSFILPCPMYYERYYRIGQRGRFGYARSSQLYERHLKPNEVCSSSHCPKALGFGKVFAKCSRSVRLTGQIVDDKGPDIVIRLLTQSFQEGRNREVLVLRGNLLTVLAREGYLP
jgi:hypothetical protein